MACINVVWYNSIGTRETTEENFSRGKKKDETKVLALTFAFPSVLLLCLHFSVSDF